jgi:hypothetical protein
MNFFFRTKSKIAGQKRRKHAISQALTEQLEVRTLMSSIPVGAVSPGSIAPGGEVDQWTFSGKTGDRFEMITTSSPRTSGFRAYTEVVAPSGGRVAQFAPGINQVLVLRETGTYKVLIRDDNSQQDGTYTIGLEGIMPISPNSVPLVKGGIVDGKIETSLEKDQWTFSGKAGDRFEMITTSSPRTFGFKAYTEVFAPSGARVARFAPGINQVLDLRETGTYMVQIRDDNFQQDGTYTIGLEGINPHSPGTRTFALGTEVSGTVSAALQKDQWLVNVPSGKVLAMSLFGTALDSGFNVSADLYDSSGAKVTVANAGITKRPLSAGVYLIQIRDASLSRRGSYRLRIWLE